MSQISVYNPLGQCVLSIQSDGHPTLIDLRDAVPGLYLLRIVTEQGEKVKRIAVMR
jgi:hypothetical protein